MPDPFTIFQTLFGRPPAEAQLAGMLGQAPGQPGSPQGPQPLAGQNAPPGGPARPDGSPDPSGGPSPPQQQQQPQILQSPPDLAQAYLALSQQNQAKQDFWGGLAGVAQALHPGRVTPGMVKSITGTSQDAGSLFNNFMQINQWQQQNQALQAFQRSVADYATKTGMTQDEVRAIGPQGMAEVMSKIAEANAGVGGGPAWMSQQRAEKALTDAGEPIPWTPHDPASYNAWNTVNIAEKKQAGEDIGNAKDSFSAMNANYTNMRDNMDWLVKHKPAVVEALTTLSPTGGPLGKGAGAVGLVSQDAQTAAQKLALMKQQLYASNFRGTKQRLAAAEAQRLGDQFTTLNAGALNMAPGDIETEIDRLSNQMAAGHANVIAAAGQELPEDLADKADKIYLDPKSSLYAYGNKPPAIAKAKDAPADSGGGGGGPQQSGGGSGGGAPPVPGAKKASDGNWYVPDPARPGKYLRVE